MFAEEEIDKTLLGNRTEKLINQLFPRWFIHWFKKEGCNCQLRQDFLNNVHLLYREYRENVKLNDQENEKSKS